MHKHAELSLRDLMSTDAQLPIFDLTTTANPNGQKARKRKIDKTLAEIRRLHDELNTQLYAMPKERPTINSPGDAFRVLQGFLSPLDHEELWVLGLDTRNRVMNLTKLYQGSVNSSQVRVGEVFRQAIIDNAPGIILAHNHPSGDPSPSPDDVSVTRSIVQAGKLLDISVLDHLVIGGERFVSLKERERCWGFLEAADTLIPKYPDPTSPVIQKIGDSMTIQDTNLKEKVLRAIALQAQGAFVSDYHHELPLPGHKELVNLRYSHERDENGRYYDYETPWGKFSSDTENSLVVVMRKGTPPAELLPQPRLELATATLHTGYVAIHNNGSSFEMDFKTRDRLCWETLRIINQTLAAENMPIAVWQVDEAKTDTPASDPHLQRLSHAVCLQRHLGSGRAAAGCRPDRHHQPGTAESHQGNPGTERWQELPVAQDAGKQRLSAWSQTRLCTVNNHLTPVNAEGTVSVLLHPLSGDPQANPSRTLLPGRRSG